MMKCKPLLHYFLKVAKHYVAFRLAMVQLAVGKDKAKNVQHACQMIRNAAQKGANMVVLPVRCVM